ncbi:MAG TPA: protein-L-isoaspartate(D-aspartate) O-methyltransferase [Methanomassiliicoccales archaeon]|jgi:protein-L-isoaspartate(D-aspartate) O-methyltransferase
MSTEQERKRMVARLVASGYAYGKEAVAAMEKVERHRFLPKEMESAAYVDSPLAIGEGQTISAPHMVGMMVSGLDLHPGLKVLEIGGGSGYHAAVIGEMVKPGGHVYSIERIQSLADRARSSLETAGYAEVVTTIVADGSKGCPAYAPYDRISVACGAPDVPPPLFEQLKEGGKMLIPVGGRTYQELYLITKVGGEMKMQDMGSVLFVPLIGEYGFKE